MIHYGHPCTLMSRIYPAVMEVSHPLINVSYPTHPHFYTVHTSEIMRHVSLNICLILLSAASSGFVHWGALCGLWRECLFMREYTCKNMWSFSWNFLCCQSSATIRDHSGLWTTSQSAIVIILRLMAQTCLNRPSTARIARRGCFLLSLPCQRDSSLINHKRMLLSKRKKSVCCKGQDIPERSSQLKIKLKYPLFYFQALGVSGTLLDLGLVSVMNYIKRPIVAFH